MNNRDVRATWKYHDDTKHSPWSVRNNEEFVEKGCKQGIFCRRLLHQRDKGGFPGAIIRSSDCMLG
jgi:hypothetical protein